MSDTVAPRGRLVARVLLWAAAAALTAHLLFTLFGLGKPQLSGFFNQWVYDAVTVLAASACLLRGLLVRQERAAWLAIATGAWLWGLGDIYWNLELAHLDQIPYPSLADVFYVAGYPAFYAGLGLLARQRLARFDHSLWLDGVIGGLAIAAMAATFVYPALEGSTSGSVSEVAVNLTYPLGDVLLLSLVVGSMALTGWRPERGLLLLGSGLAVVAVADAIFLHQEATSGYAEGSWPDSLWLAGALATALAAWTPSGRPTRVRLEGRRVLAVPTLFALSAASIAVYDQFNQVNHLAMSLAVATLIAVIVRMSFTFEEYLRLLHKTRHEAMTDPLTGLGNRRLLLDDLAHAVEYERNRQTLFALFDLDGFKAYNDTFGHPAGDVLLTRLGQNLAAAVGPQGRAYRLGGDEFCVLSPLAGRRPSSIAAAASAALCEEGEAFSIANSHGTVLLPDEVSDASSALKLADRRLYAQKRRRPRSPERQTRSVLLSVLREREPSLHAHLEGVALWAFALGQALELEAEELDVVARAAELHDVGKMAIPDDVLKKAAPLTDVEWQLMHKHTVVGERILAAAPAMVPVARLVRSSHERWDGCGYPDGLGGEDIPLGSRIIAVCDAYEAMVETRAWRGTFTPQQAIEELRSCAGSQFDPRLVKVFCDEVQPQFHEPARVEPVPASSL